MDIKAFILFGIIASISIGSFIALIIVSGFKNKIFKWLIGIVLSLIIGFGLTGAISLQCTIEDKAWNNGRCTECRTKFELFEIEHVRNSGELYYYKCKNGHIIKLHNSRN